MPMELIPHWIAGKRVASTSGQEATVHNPATGKPRAQVGLASVAEVDAAVDAARAAFPAWRATSLSQRAEVLFGLRALIDARRDQIAALLTAEHGKVLSDSLGEIARGLAEDRSASPIRDAVLRSRGRRHGASNIILGGRPFAG